MKERLVLVTVIFENVLREEIVALFTKHKTTGFTISRVDGQGSRGVRASEFEGPNLKIESVASREVADAVLDAIAENYFEDYSVIAWDCEVNVLRGRKFSP
ncbi:MAG: P-II family nitrogen regulator [Roseibacillus sp.]